MQYVLEKPLIKQTDVFQRYLTQRQLFTAVGNHVTVFVQQVC